MADPNIALYNFYKRYKWLAEDFEGWQTGMVALGRGMFEGLIGAAVLTGYEADVPVTGMDMDVSAGIASGPTGYLHVNAAPVTLSVPVPSTNPVKHLIVSRPVLVSDTIITRPTLPNDLVALRTLQTSQVLLLEGAEGIVPVYPTKEANDVVLFGVNVEPSATGVNEAMLDLEQRDIPGKNSDFHQHNSKYDDRVRVFQVNAKSYGIKPSQTSGGQPRCFTYVDKGIHSSFPMHSSFKFNDADTFLDFETGVISGGDEVTPDFTPTIPSAGKFIVASVSLLPTDRLDISFGIEGSLDECFDGIINKRLVGAGAINTPRNMLRLAYIILYSLDGSTIADSSMMDARSTFYFGGPDPQAMIMNRTLNASQVIYDNEVMWAPGLKLVNTQVVDVKSGGRLLSEGSITLLDSSVIIMEPGSTGRVL